MCIRITGVFVRNGSIISVLEVESIFCIGWKSGGKSGGAFSFSIYSSQCQKGLCQRATKIDEKAPQKTAESKRIPKETQEMNPDSQCPPPPPITTIIPIDYSNNNDPNNPPSGASSGPNPQRKPKTGNGGRRKKGSSSKQPQNEAPHNMDHDYRDFFSRPPRSQGEFLTRGAALASTHGDMTTGDLGVSLAQQAAAVAASRQQQQQQHLDGNPVYSVSAGPPPGNGAGQRGILVEQQLPLQGHDDTRRFVNHELVRTRSGGGQVQKEPSRARNPTILRKSMFTIGRYCTDSAFNVLGCKVLAAKLQ